MSSTYDLHLASGCYSKRRRCKSNVGEDKSYRGGVQHLKERKEDIGGEGVKLQLMCCALGQAQPSYFGGAELRRRRRSRSRSRS